MKFLKLSIPSQTSFGNDSNHSDDCHIAQFMQFIFDNGFKHYDFDLECVFQNIQVWSACSHTIYVY